MNQKSIQSFFAKATRYEVLDDKDKTMDEIGRKNEQHLEEQYNKKRKLEEEKRNREMEKKRKQREFERRSNILIEGPESTLIYLV